MTAGVRSCVACNANCKSCTSATTCVACLSNFFLSSGTCTRCPNNCDICTTATTCALCDAGFFRGTVNNVQTCYAQCPESFFPQIRTTPAATAIDPQPLLCTACALNCLRCPSPTACSLCSSGFFLTTGATCTATCPDLSFADPISRTCLDRCPAGLVGVSTTKTCVATCPTGFFPGDN